MNVRGVAGQKAAAGAELIDASRVDLVSGEPVYLVDIELELRVFDDLLLDLFIQDLAFLLIRVFREDTDDAIAILALHRKESRRPVARHARRKHVVRKFPFEIDVRDIKQALVRAAFKLQTKARANRTLRAVARHEILRFDLLFFAVDADDSARHPRVVLRKV